MGRRRKKGIARFFKNLSWPELDLDPETKKGIFIVVIMAIGAISLLGLFDMAGLLGLEIKEFLISAFGWTRWLIPPLLLLWGYALYDEERFSVRGGNYLGAFMLVISLGALFFLLIERNAWEVSILSGAGGGKVGYFFADMSLTYLGFFASLLVSLGALVVSLLLLLNTTLSNLFGPDSWFAKIMFPINFVLAKMFNLRKREDEEDEEHEEEEEEEEESEEDDEEEEEEEHEEEGDEEEEENEEEENEDDEENEDEEEEEKISPPPPMPAKVIEEIWWMHPGGSNLSIPLSLLDGKRGKATSGDIAESKTIIRQALENFGIPVEMGAVSVGPTVTQFTFRPAEGVKLSKITNLSNDLALALASHPIRIEAPIPGKALVGVEVPNQAKAVVSLKEILVSRNYKERKNDMHMALGKDVAGNAWVTDITKMPHLLVAGATNSGKSVCLNTIIVSLMYQNTPDNLKFIMVDPKRVELVGYNGIPYLMAPVITEVPKTINALKWCLNEMDRRFDILSKSGQRNIQSYNETNKIKMPYLIFIIDELADLMVAASKDIEGSIIRLAQMARAVGIHLVLATQRPSVDVITGLIKANMPARIAFSVASSTDSRTILDTLGAEKLLGRGDMLFMNAELSKPVRLQGAFLSDEEISKVVRYAKSKGGKPTFVDGITDRQKVSGIGGIGLDGVSGDEDELLHEARETVVNMGKASASFLQRKLRIGYARAASILDQLEEAGIIGPANGAKAREILISKQQLGALESQGVSGASLHDRKETKAPENYLGEESEDPPVFSDEDDEKLEVRSENLEEEEDIFDDEDEEKEEGRSEKLEDEDGEDDEENEDEEDGEDGEENEDEEDGEENEEDEDEGEDEDEDDEEEEKEEKRAKKDDDSPVFDKLFSK